MGRFLIFAMTLWSQNIAWGQNESEAPDTLKVKFRRYVMRKYFDSLEHTYCFDVLREGQVEYKIKAAKASYLQFVAINGTPTFDIDKDTAHNFILQEYLGGERQQTTWHILNLRREKCVLSGKLTTDFSVPWLIDIDKDGKYEFLTKDYTFANWNTDFIHSPFVEIISTLQNGRFTLIPKKLENDSLLTSPHNSQKIKTSLEEFYQNAIKAYPYKVNTSGGESENRWGFVPPKLWEIMLELIYAGKSEKAWLFLDQCWYEKLEGKTLFMADFIKQLQKSEHWEVLRQLNQFP